MKLKIVREYESGRGKNRTRVGTWKTGKPAMNVLENARKG